jgi:hypothetical protein
MALFARPWLLPLSSRVGFPNRAVTTLIDPGLAWTWVGAAVNGHDMGEEHEGHT